MTRRPPILVWDLAATGEIVLAAPMIAGAAGTNNPPEAVYAFTPACVPKTLSVLMT
ncbi:MAG TPA: hypothetical protein VE058_09485 [Steroidobacteraceae bacterium]|nr:hypothetical protein [Steroidobacteraceae bacterium]